MAANPQNNWSPILYFVEGKQHPIEFVEGLYEELLAKAILKDKFHQLKSFYKKFGGGDQIGSWKLPQIKENWKTLLESILEDIMNIDKKVLLMFDELPLMLAKFIKLDEKGAQIGIEFLDMLRELRNKFEPTKKVAFIFCGSIGIHLIIKDLKKNYGYNSDPINNMKIIAISGMDNPGARLLCEKLSEETKLQFNNKEKIFDYICKNTDNLPFYIQHLFAYFWENKKEIIDEKVIDEAVTHLLNDPQDIGFFNHYTDRIKTYYDDNMRKIALHILDKACKKKGFWIEDDIRNEVKTEIETDNEFIKETLALLWSDHYLNRKIDKSKRCYKFNYSILQQWWKVNRG
ncbi:MAG: hypothetical protein GY754_30335 [bacterium]|nr:hypothetical protein [bacterium]